jgi:hypothetical protein
VSHTHGKLAVGKNAGARLQQGTVLIRIPNLLIILANYLAGELPVV